MQLEEALKLVLGANARVTALVSTRIYPGVLPQTVVYPAIAYRLVTRERVDRLESRGSAGLARSRYRFFATSHGIGTYGVAKAIDAAIYACLQGFSAVVTDGASPESTLYIQGIQSLTVYDFYEPDTETHQVISDFEVWASEPLPT